MNGGIPIAVSLYRPFNREDTKTTFRLNLDYDMNDNVMLMRQQRQVIERAVTTLSSSVRRQHTIRKSSLHMSWVIRLSGLITRCS